MEEIEVKALKELMKTNDEIANSIREKLKRQNTLFVNIMGSPGSGKTSLLEATIKKLREKVNNLGVIEGDIETDIDLQRLKGYGIKIQQINTGPFGGDCHLEAKWIEEAINKIGIEGLDYLFVENIGNLVCPAEFDIGAHLNICVLSVTEGDDKPLKYPLMFKTVNLCIISKIDLLPYVDFSKDRFKEALSKINHKLKLLEVSAKEGIGIEEWIELLKSYKEKLSFPHNESSSNKYK